MKLDWHIANSEQAFIGVFFTTDEAHAAGELPDEEDFLQVSLDAISSSLKNGIEDIIVLAVDNINHSGDEISSEKEALIALQQAVEEISVSSQAALMIMRDIDQKFATLKAKEVLSLPLPGMS